MGMAPRPLLILPKMLKRSKDDGGDRGDSGYGGENNRPVHFAHPFCPQGRHVKGSAGAEFLKPPEGRG